MSVEVVSTNNPKPCWNSRPLGHPLIVTCVPAVVWNPVVKTPVFAVPLPADAVLSALKAVMLTIVPALSSGSGFVIGKDASFAIGLKPPTSVIRPLTLASIAPVVATVVSLLDFENIPEQARRYITIRASRIFHDRTLGANALHRFSRQDELVALSILKQSEASVADHSIFNSHDQFKTVSRSRSHKLID